MHHAYFSNHSTRIRELLDDHMLVRSVFDPDTDPSGIREAYVIQYVLKGGNGKESVILKGPGHPLLMSFQLLYQAVFCPYGFNESGHIPC